MVWILGTTKARTVGRRILQFALLNFSHAPSKFCPRIYVPDLYSAFTLQVYVPELCSEFILRIYSQNLCSEFIFKIYVPDLHSTFTFCVYSSRSWSYILKWTSSQQTPVYSAFLPRISSRRLRNHKILHSIWSTYHWLFCWRRENQDSNLSHVIRLLYLLIAKMQFWGKTLLGK